MKRIILLVIFFSILLFGTVSKTAAQIPPGVVIPGQTCGNPLSVDPLIRKCCYYAPQRMTNISKPGIPVVDQAIDLFSTIIDKFILTPVLNPLSELTQKTIQPCLDGQPSTPGDLGNASCVCNVPVISPLDKIKPLCENIDKSKGSGEYNNCLSCLSGTGTSGLVGVWTGLGCIYTDTKSFIEETVFGLGVGLAGGFSLLCIVYAAFMMQSSQGNPEKLKKAQEMITSCIMGLMLIIFSAFILRLIGVNILRIPGFS